MADGNRPLTHEELLDLRLAATADGLIVTGSPGKYVIIGRADPRYVALLRASGSLYQTLNTVQRLLATFLETADLIREDALAEQLQRITASVDLALKFSRDEA